MTAETSLAPEMCRLLFGRLASDIVAASMLRLLPPRTPLLLLF